MLSSGAIAQNHHNSHPSMSVSLKKVVLGRLADPVRLSILTGVVSSSYLYLGNVSTAWFGVVPLIHDDVVVSTPQQKAAQWAYFYDKAKVHFVTSILISGISYSTAAFLSKSTSIIRTPLIVAALMSFTVAPFTMLVIAPTNNTLKEVRDTPEEEGSEPNPNTAFLKQKTNRLLADWTKLNALRMGISFTAWVTGLATLVAY